MGFPIPHHFSTAEGAHCLFADGIDYIGTWCIIRFLQSTETGLCKGRFINDARIPPGAQIVFILQNPLDHVFVPLCCVLVVWGMPHGHVICDLLIGVSSQIAVKDVPHSAGFLLLQLNFTADDVVPEGGFSLPSHLSSAPFHRFDQFQTVDEPDFKPISREEDEAFDECQEHVFVQILLPAAMFLQIEEMRNLNSFIIEIEDVAINSGDLIHLQLMVGTQAEKDAVWLSLTMLPFSACAALLFSVIFSYFYSRRLTRPIRSMVTVTEGMKDLKQDA